jgi:hypothetical protein
MVIYLNVGDWTKRKRRKRDKNALFRFDLTMEEALYLLTNYDKEDTSVHVSGR